MNVQEEVALAAGSMKNFAKNWPAAREAICKLGMMGAEASAACRELQAVLQKEAKSA